ncbi:scm3p [Saccharomyces arboricola H-6]|uniref:Scm3p n=1 Tax=Saccharomyces arboricola (strain H-6 / AS 2.3317 / CBS 10644) TaxID=1160507 RepID=J8Q9Z7_SACAR|nr:scm3p [Saccharomyces arboricola H-6]
MKTSKKISKKKSLKNLHGALKKLLNESSKKNETGIRKQNDYSSVPKTKMHTPTMVKNKTKKRKNIRPIAERNGHIYILSKENQVIPKLTDDEVMERHKQADETMKEVWSNIISKYESLEDQGDLVDLKTGEIIEDNGHIKKLTANSTTNDKKTRYTSVLRDIIDISDYEDGSKDDEYTIWANASEASESGTDAESVHEDEEDEEELKTNAYLKDYETKLSKKIVRD